MIFNTSNIYNRHRINYFSLGYMFKTRYFFFILSLFINLLKHFTLDFKGVDSNLSIFVLLDNLLLGFKNFLKPISQLVFFEVLIESCSGSTIKVSTDPKFLEVEGNCKIGCLFKYDVFLNTSIEGVSGTSTTPSLLVLTGSILTGFIGLLNSLELLLESFSCFVFFGSIFKLEDLIN
ncbi:hypothetical protein AGLY_011740 [Aphis glycines]|uniref:Uncharacterized protein n=1 Tax=Aphis glycines TaxID=307491 RepID=A0A6G0TD72_APHGL|nr:hypothetical protein AGLY_011740 [Aphis glycines]